MGGSYSHPFPEIKGSGRKAGLGGKIISFILNKFN